MQVILIIGIATIMASISLVSMFLQTNLNTDYRKWFRRRYTARKSIPLEVTSIENAPKSVLQKIYR